MFQMSSEDSSIEPININQSSKPTNPSPNSNPIPIRHYNSNPKSNSNPNPIHHYKQSPITINNNIPELKLNNEQSYDVPNYMSSLVILILGCLTLNPCLLLINPCLNYGAEYINYKRAVVLSTIFGITLCLGWFILGFVYLILTYGLVENK